MPLRGERQDAATYIDLRELEDGSNQLIRCSHRVLGTDCVQKVVPIGPRSAEFAEPRLLERLDHDRIPPVREAQFDPVRKDCVTFVMPWYPGGSVARALVDGHRFSISECIAIVRDVLDALEYVHTVHGHVHRDVKTSNVLLNETRNRAFLTDFERAGELLDGTATAVVATVFYMAPECVPTGRHTVQSDIYGVGLLLFELLNGRSRWEDMDQAGVDNRIREGMRSVPDRLIAPASFAPHVPQDLVRLTRRALSREPDRRFSSARAMLAALNRVAAIDWRPPQQDDTYVGEWVGTWPPSRRTDDRRLLRVATRPLGAGQRRGALRATATVQAQLATTPRRFGVADATIDPGDAAALRQFFSDVAARVAQSWPAS